MANINPTVGKIAKKTDGVITVPYCQKYTPTDCFLDDFAHWVLGVQPLRTMNLDTTTVTKWQFRAVIYSFQIGMDTPLSTKQDPQHTILSCIASMSPPVH